MPSPRLISLTVILAGGLALFAGLWNLARFGSTSGYPPYSSLRSGPDGSKLLFEALAQTPGFSVDRSYLPLDDLNTKDAVILLLGVHPGTLVAANDTLFHSAMRLAGLGNRVVVQIAPAPLMKPVDAKQWDARFEKGGRVIPGPSWHLLNAHIFERSIKSGVIVLADRDASLTSGALAGGEAQREIAGLVLGNKRHVIFEETHLGIAETGSIAGLARRYRLQGLLYGLLSVAALFVWHRSASFPPPLKANASSPDLVSSVDSSAMLSGLLAKHIKPQSLIGTCVTEWNRTSPRHRLHPIVSSAADPVMVYRRIQADLKGRNRFANDRQSR